GKVCDGMGACVECNADSKNVATQCKGGEFCSTDSHSCLSLQCKDGKKDGAETGSDCGGPDCDACGNGQGCKGADDCKSGYCFADSGAGGGGGAGATMVCAGCTK